MAQKVNPISLRLGKTNLTSDSSWFSNSNYSNLLQKNIKLQSYINLILKQIKYSSARYSIINLPNKTKVNIFFYNPNKDRLKAFKILRLRSYKKPRKVKKNFINKKFNKINDKQSKIFHFLTLNLNINNLVFFFKKKSTLKDLKENCFVKNKLNNLFYLFLLQKLNNFYIKYFLIKYFNLKNKPEIKKKKIEKLFHKQKKLKLEYFSSKKNEQTILFNYINSFLFFKIFKFKTFLALNYFKSTIHMCLSEKQILENLNYNLVKKKQYNFNSTFEKMNILLENFKKKHFSFNETKLNNVLSTNRYFYLNKLVYYKNYVNLKFLNKYKHDYLDVSFFTKKNEKNLIISISKKEKKTEKTYEFFKNLVSTTGLEKQDKLQTYFLPLIENQKYSNVSLMNNQCLNKTYHKYCNISKCFKYYNYFFSTNKQASINDKLMFPINSFKNSFLIENKAYRNHMEAIMTTSFCNSIHLHFFKTKDMFTNALFLINEIVYYIENRVSFFRIKQYIMKLLTDPESKSRFSYVKGIRVMCSGRVGGKSKKAQRSKIQNFKYGETSLHVFSSKIDFKSKIAYTSFGTLGVKIWISYK